MEGPELNGMRFSTSAAGSERAGLRRQGRRRPSPFWIHLRRSLERPAPRLVGVRSPLRAPGGPHPAGGAAGTALLEGPRTRKPRRCQWSRGGRYDVTGLCLGASRAPFSSGSTIPPSSSHALHGRGRRPRRPYSPQGAQYGGARLLGFGALVARVMGRSEGEVPSLRRWDHRKCRTLRLIRDA
jgi:hypothetical protein